VLKAIGFPGSRVLVLILGEACAITLAGGVLGVALGCGCLQLLHHASSQFFPFAIHEMLGPWLVYLIAVSAGIGLVSGMFPASRAARLSVVNGLRRV
jgi:putative ABC transport system permease protein